MTTGANDEAGILDVRPMRKPDKHPAIFAAYRELEVGDSFTLVNDHDPQHLRDDFETEYPGSYSWEYVSTQPRDWRVRITKHTSTALPRLLADTNELPADPAADGAIWKLETRDRDLDSNIIALQPGDTIDTHNGPDLDVLIHVLSGDGVLGTERGDVQLAPGKIVWLPRRSERGFRAGSEGLRYLTVHRKRQALVIENASSG